MKRFGFIFILVVVLLSSCTVKYKETTLDDGTVVYSVDSDMPEAAKVKSLANKALDTSSFFIDEAVSGYKSVKEKSEQFDKEFAEAEARLDADIAQKKERHEALWDSMFSN